MIKPLDEFTIDGNGSGILGVAEGVKGMNHLRRAINMLIEHVNILTRASFGEMTYESIDNPVVSVARDILNTEVDPNAPD